MFSLSSKVERKREIRDEKMKSTWSLVIAAAVIIAVLVFLSSTGKKAPLIPSDTIHAVSSTQESCLACHAPGKQAPLKANHPPKEQCFICHKAKKS